MIESTRLPDSHLKGFEDIKQIDENGVEFWSVRDLFSLMGYVRWENFSDVINKAQKACFKSGQNIEDHFRQLTKMIEIGKTATRKVKDYKLDRYAYYLNETSMRKIALTKLETFLKSVI